MTKPALHSKKATAGTTNSSTTPPPKTPDGSTSTSTATNDTDSATSKVFLVAVAVAGVSGYLAYDSYQKRAIQGDFSRESELAVSPTSTEFPVAGEHEMNEEPNAEQAASSESAHEDPAPEQPAPEQPAHEPEPAHQPVEQLGEAAEIVVSALQQVCESTTDPERESNEPATETPAATCGEEAEPVPVDWRVTKEQELAQATEELEAEKQARIASGDLYSVPFHLEALREDQLALQREIEDYLAQMDNTLGGHIKSLAATRHLLARMDQKFTPSESIETLDQARAYIQHLQSRLIEMDAATLDKPSLEGVHQLQDLLRERYRKAMESTAHAVHGLLQHELTVQHARLAQEFREELTTQLNLVRQHDAESSERELQEALDHRSRDFRKHAEERQAEMAAMFEEEKGRHVEAMVQWKHKLGNYQRLVAEQKDLERASARVHKLSALLQTVEQDFDAAHCFGPAWVTLREAASADPLLSVAISTLPADIVQGRVPAASKVEQAFKAAERKALRATYLPPQPTIWGYIFAGVFEKLTLRDYMLVEGDDDRARIKRAGFLLRAGDLAGASKEVSLVEDVNVQDATAEWLTVAKRRIQGEQAMDVIRARIRALELAFSSTSD